MSYVNYNESYLSLFIKACCLTTDMVSVCTCLYQVTMLELKGYSCSAVICRPACVALQLLELAAARNAGSRRWCRKGHKNHISNEEVIGEKYSLPDYIPPSSRHRKGHSLWLEGPLLTFLGLVGCLRTHLPFFFKQPENWTVCFNKYKIQLHMARDVVDLILSGGKEHLCGGREHNCGIYIF